MDLKTESDGAADKLQYADRPPMGYTLADNGQEIQRFDMVYFPSSDTMDAVWRHPQHGENLIGSSVRESWPRILGLAVSRSKND